MPLKKAYLKSRPACKVTFTIGPEAAGNTRCVHLAGDFNGWDTSATRLKKKKDGGYCVTIELTPGFEYQFRYFLDESLWDNDWDADKYVPSSVSDAYNSVVVV